MAESRVTANKLEILTAANHGRITADKLEILSRTSLASGRTTAVKLEILSGYKRVVISGAAVASVPYIDLTITEDSGYAVSFSVYRSESPTVALIPGNLIYSGIPATGTPQIIGDTTTDPAKYYFYKIVETNALGTIVSNEIAVESGGWGDPPQLQVGGITGATAELTVNDDPIYTEVHYILTEISDTYYTSPVFEVTDSSADRFLVTATGLTIGVTYKVKANWLGPLGWSGYSNEVIFVSVPPIIYATFDTILTPKFGESIRGSSYLVTWPQLQPGETADLDISDDLGLSWSNVVGGLTGTSHSINPSSYTDGVDYLLRVVGDMGTVYIQLCFYIDNANTGTNYWHDIGGYNVDIYDPTKFAKGLNTNANWQGNITGLDFAMLAQNGGTDVSALIARAIQRHTEIDITCVSLVDSGEGVNFWNRYWAAEGIRHGIVAALDTNDYISAFIDVGYIWPYADYPTYYANCGSIKGSSVDSYLRIFIRSGAFQEELFIKLGRIYARVRGCGTYENPRYSTRLKITYPDRVSEPWKVRIRATTFGLGLAIPSTFVDDYWLIDEVVSMKDPVVPFTEYPLDCGCAGAFAGKIKGSFDEPGRAEFSTLGAAVLEADCFGAPGLCTGPSVPPPADTPLVPGPSLPGTGTVPCIPCAVLPSYIDDSASSSNPQGGEVCGPTTPTSDDDEGRQVSYVCT